jgi:hypothetical protein
MVVKAVLSLVPRVVTAVMMTTAMRATIRPYSMAVAPDSSLGEAGHELGHCRLLPNWPCFRPKMKFSGHRDLVSKQRQVLAGVRGHIVAGS